MQGILADLFEQVDPATASGCSETLCANGCAAFASAPSCDQTVVDSRASDFGGTADRCGSGLPIEPGAARSWDGGS